MKSRIVYIGRNRVTSLAGYTLGDAQIDAQNRTTDQIGQVGNAYSAVKNAGGLTVSYIQSAMNQISGLIDSYNNQYGGTSRGKAGTTTLANFVNQQIFPTMQSDLAAAANASGTQSPVIPGGVSVDPTTIPFDFAPNPNSNYNITINPSGNSVSTPGDTSPSQSPGPPSGIVIPGTSVDVVGQLEWYQNPAMLALIGIGIAIIIGSRQKNT